MREIMNQSRTCLVALCLCTALCAGGTNEISTGGGAQEVGAWLIAGPVVLSAVESYTRKYFQGICDDLPRTWAERCAAGTAIATKWGGMQWRGVANDGEKPDLRGVSTIDHALYLASRSWVSPMAQKAELRLGSDDAVCVWLNGERVYTYSYKRGYVPEGVVVGETLREGTNSAVFALINADELREVGARMYPCSAPLDDEVFVCADGRLQTGDWARIAAYWLPASGPAKRPQLAIYSNTVLIGDCEVITPGGAMLTNFVFARGRAFPGDLRCDLRGREEGVYRVVTVCGGRAQSSWFVRMSSPDATRHFWLRLAQYHHVRAPEKLATIFTSFPDDIAFTNAFHGSIVRAYRSRFTGDLQPYLLSVPERLVGATSCPLMVHLKYSAPGVTRETWSASAFRSGAIYDDVIVVTPYDYGDAGYVGLGERDLFAVVDDVARLYRIDKERIYAEGYSMGAGGTWRVAQRHPDFFAAVAAQGGYACQFPLNLRNLPIWQREGEQSHPENIARVIEHLRWLGNDARITIEKGRDKATIDAVVSLQVKNWMMTKRRVVAPQVVTYTTYGDIGGAY